MSGALKILKSARIAELSVQSLLEQVELLHRVMKSSCGSYEKAAELAEKAADFEEKLNIALDEAVDRKREALQIISVLPDSEREVLFRHYFLCHSWTKISMDLFMSERQVFNLRKTAIERLDGKRVIPSGGAVYTKGVSEFYPNVITVA